MYVSLKGGDPTTLLPHTTFLFTRYQQIRKPLKEGRTKAGYKCQQSMILYFHLLGFEISETSHRYQSREGCKVQHTPFNIFSLSLQKLSTTKLSPSWQYQLKFSCVRFVISIPVISPAILHPFNTVWLTWTGAWHSSASACFFLYLLLFGPF